MDKLRSWDEVRAQLFSAEEIDKCDRRVAKIGRKIKKRMAAPENNSPLGGDALEFIDSLLTSEEIAASNARVAEIREEIERK